MWNKRDDWWSGIGIKISEHVVEVYVEEFNFPRRAIIDAIINA